MIKEIIKLKFTIIKRGIKIEIIDFRYYKGKYLCGLIKNYGNKAIVLWLEDCDKVGSKKLGYKSVKPMEVDIINHIRLLERSKRNG